MLFNSVAFLIFFPLVATTFFLIPLRLRIPFLLFASCVFYCWFIPAYILVLLALILVDYFAGMAIEDAEGKNKTFYLRVSILSNLALLGFFKYYVVGQESLNAVLSLFGSHWLIPHLSLLLPLGLSFHTFQSMSYTIEVHSGRQKAERNFLVYALYVMFFPQLVAGPIERPQHLIPQLRELKLFNRPDAVQGLQLLLWGFYKKLAIADNLAVLVDDLFHTYGTHSGPILYFGAMLFAIQLYCDFSGYSDIAIGCAQVLGFKLVTNFDRPYFATSISQFWRRWHMSLTSWFRDYVFYPLRHLLPAKGIEFTATFVVFLLIGPWHGANWTFVVWGALQGMAISVETVFNRIVKRRSKAKTTRLLFNTNWIGIITTFLFVSFSDIYFRSPDIVTANEIARRVATDFVGLFTGQPILTPRDLDFLQGNGLRLFWDSVLVLILFACEYLQPNWSLRMHPEKYNRAARWGLQYVVLALIALFGALEAQPFLYFRF